MRCRSIRLGLWRHTEKDLAVVAARAIIDYAGVVHQRSGKSTWIGFARGMAGLARHAGRQMGWRHPYRRNADKALAVVAAGAASDDTGVAHHPRNEAVHVMAQRAGLRGRQVICRQRASRTKLFPV